MCWRLRIVLLSSISVLWLGGSSLAGWLRMTSDLGREGRHVGYIGCIVEPGQVDTEARRRLEPPAAAPLILLHPECPVMIQRHSIPLLTILLCALLAPLLCSCSEDSAVEAKGRAAGQKIGEAWGSLVEYGYARRDELAQQFEHQLVAGEQKLGELREEVGERTGEARASLERRIEELEVGLERSRERLDEMRAAAEEGWAEARDRAGNALEALRGKVDEAPR